MAFIPGLNERLRAAGWHLLASLLVAALVAALVFGLWFPGMYRYMAGGTSLLLLIMTVDVILGPLLTFAVFDRRKGSSHLKRDIATIAILQLAALVYGLYTVQLARPVALVFEHDRFRVISAAEVVDSDLPKALPPYRQLPWNGPWLIAVRDTVAGQERNSSLATAVLDGVDTSQRPQFWIEYGPGEKSKATHAARPLQLLVEKYPASAESINKAVSEMGGDPSRARFLPVRTRNDAVAVLSEDGNLQGFLPHDGFF
jgi:hypothetical protein